MLINSSLRQLLFQWQSVIKCKHGLATCTMCFLYFHLFWIKQLQPQFCHVAHIASGSLYRNWQIQVKVTHLQLVLAPLGPWTLLNLNTVTTPVFFLMITSTALNTAQMNGRTPLICTPTNPNQLSQEWHEWGAFLDEDETNNMLYRRYSDCDSMGYDLTHLATAEISI